MYSTKYKIGDLLYTTKPRSPMAGGYIKKNDFLIILKLENDDKTIINFDEIVYSERSTYATILSTFGVSVVIADNLSYWTTKV